MQPQHSNLQTLRLQEDQLSNKANAYLVQASALADHLRIIECSMDLMHAVGAPTDGTTDDIRAIQRLSLRTFNNLGAIWRLASSGYFQQAAVLIRDVVETGQLVELFNLAPERISLFRTLDRKARRKAFSPSKVRDDLDALRNLGKSKRAEVYSKLSRLAGHPDIEGFVMQQPVGESDAAWGPFMQLKMLKAILEETAKWGAYAGVSFQQFTKESNTGRLAASNFGIALIDWSAKYTGAKYSDADREYCLAVIARNGAP